jgi:hypothetical protein
VYGGCKKVNAVLWHGVRHVTSFVTGSQPSKHAGHARNMPGYVQQPLGFMQGWTAVLCASQHSRYMWLL